MADMNKLIKLSFLLFSIFLCTAIYPAIASAQEDASAALLESAGLGAYVKLDSIDQTTFDNATASLFNSVESFGTDYMIGVKNYYAHEANSEALVPLHFYLRTDGWLVVYLLNSQESSMIVNWNDGASLEDNLLKLAVEDAAGTIGASYDDSSIKYYDFAHPDASQMTLVRENIEDNSQLMNSFSILVPGTVYQATYAMASFGGALKANTSWANLYLDNNMVHNAKTTDNFVYGNYDESLFTAQISHEVIMHKADDIYPASTATLILYRAD